MTPEQMRIKIAEVCGWKIERSGVFKYDEMEMPWTIWSKDGSEYNPGSVPDYLNDLNAMHEAEKVIVNQLGSDVRSRWFIHMQAFTDVAGIHATALQRAEAFLKTLNLYE